MQQAARVCCPRLPRDQRLLRANHCAVPARYGSNGGAYSGQDPTCAPKTALFSGLFLPRGPSARKSPGRKMAGVFPARLYPNLKRSSINGNSLRRPVAPETAIRREGLSCCCNGDHNGVCRRTTSWWFCCLQRPCSRTGRIVQGRCGPRPRTTAAQASGCIQKTSCTQDSYKASSGFWRCNARHSILRARLLCNHAM